MRFFNTDGMAFIEPVSEGFWIALTGILLGRIRRSRRRRPGKPSVDWLPADTSIG